MRSFYDHQVLILQLTEGHEYREGVSHPVHLYVEHKTTGEKISFDDYKSLPELQKQEYKVTPFMKHFYVFNIDQTDNKDK